MEEIKLTSRLRDDVGKKIAHKLRARGEIPAILYGHKEEPLALIVPEHEFWHILHNATSEHLILKLNIEDMEGGDVMTLVRDVQHHPVTGDVLHVDLQRISLDEKIKVGVPVELVGMARGVKDFGGVLDHGVREVNVRCTPRQIPPALEVDVTDMEIGQSVHISDITMHYPLLEFLDDRNVTLAHVSPPKKLEVAVAEAEEGEEEAAAEEAAAEETSKAEAEEPGEEK